MINGLCSSTKKWAVMQNYTVCVFSYSKIYGDKTIIISDKKFGRFSTESQKKKKKKISIMRQSHIGSWDLQSIANSTNNDNMFRSTRTVYARRALWWWQCLTASHGRSRLINAPKRAVVRDDGRLEKWWIRRRMKTRNKSGLVRDNGKLENRSCRIVYITVCVLESIIRHKRGVALKAPRALFVYYMYIHTHYTHTYI